MGSQTIVLFGEAEKGDYSVGYFCRSLFQLMDCLGNPPPDSQGLYYATQALLFRHHLIFFRVREEGFYTQDYLHGLRSLENPKLRGELAAICAPGVGDSEIIDAFIPICLCHHSILIVNEADLYDYLTSC